MRLKGKVAIFTGGGTGIGAATALIFAKEGVKIVAAGRRLEPISSVANTITSEGGEAISCQADVTQVEQVKALIKKTVSTYGKLDVVFANAGSPHRERYLTYHSKPEKTLS